MLNHLITSSSKGHQSFNDIPGKRGKYKQTHRQHSLDNGACFCEQNEQSGGQAHAKITQIRSGPQPFRKGTDIFGNLSGFQNKRSTSPKPMGTHLYRFIKTQKNTENPWK